MDLVEMRLDLYPGIDVEAAIRESVKPVVATVRRERDGGRFGGAQAERRALLARAHEAAYLDIECDVPEGFGPDSPRRVVSHHDLEGMPADLDGVYRRCHARGADVVKIAATPSSEVEAFRLLDLPAPGIGMGSFGGFTRVLASWTYCASEAVAPGIPTPSALFDRYRIRRYRPGFGLYGVAGDPVGRSRSPELHNPALERDGIDALYLTFRVTDLANFWPVFLGHGGRGLSVTAPLKVQAAGLALYPDDDVKECGAANTLLADGRAHNTDLTAFLDLVPRGGGPALVLGAGGAARAAVTALARLGYDVSVWARNRERAAALGHDVADRIESAPVVVNTTPLDPPPSPFVVDLRYGPDVSDPRCGVSGMDFLRAQARHQYRIFTGRAL